MRNQSTSTEIKKIQTLPPRKANVFEETFDVFSKKGVLQLTNVPASYVHMNELWHEGILAIIESHDGKLLLQRRNKDKICGHMWDISLGGHIQSSETQTDGLYHELNEELGLNLCTDDINDVHIDYIGKTKDEVLMDNKFLHKEIQHNFWIRLNEHLTNKIKHNTLEIDAIAWYTKSEILSMFEDTESTFVPQHFVQRTNAWKLFLRELRQR